MQKSNLSHVRPRRSHRNGPQPLPKTQQESVRLKTGRAMLAQASPPEDDGAWHEKSTADPYLYLNDEDDEIMTVNVHVDDCCICYSSEQKYQAFRKRLESEFQISKSDDSNSFLGVIIERPNADKRGQGGPILVYTRGPTSRTFFRGC